MTQTTPKPCPCCGSPAELHVGSNGSYDTSDYFVECSNEDCGITTPMQVGHRDVGEQLIEVWNRRAA